jgi:hypothetical protein
MGLDTIADLARKYEQSVPNFARVLSKHHAIVSHYPSYRAARLFKTVPGVRVWCGALKLMALMPLLPARLRALSLRMYRASLYARVV